MTSECQQHLNKSLRAPPVSPSRLADILNRRDLFVNVSRYIQMHSSSPAALNQTYLPYSQINFDRADSTAWLLLIVMVLVIWMLSWLFKRLQRPLNIIRPGEAISQPSLTWIPDSVARSANVTNSYFGRIEWNVSEGMKGEMKELENIVQETLFEFSTENENYLAKGHDSAWVPAGLSLRDKEIVDSARNHSRQQRVPPGVEILSLPSDDEIMEWLKEASPGGTTAVHSSSPTEKASDVLHDATLSSLEEEEEEAQQSSSFGDNASSRAMSKNRDIEGYTIKVVSFNGTFKYVIKRISAQHQEVPNTVQESQSSEEEGAIPSDESRTMEQMQMLDGPFRTKILELLFERNRAEPERRLFEWSIKSIEVPSSEKAVLSGLFGPARVNFFIRKRPRNDILHSYRAPPEEVLGNGAVHTRNHSRQVMSANDGVATQVPMDVSASSRRSENKALEGKSRRIVDLGTLRKRITRSRRA